MKFTIGSNELRSVLRDIGGALNAREPVECFRFIRIACKGDELRFTAQNARYAITSKMTYAESRSEHVWVDGEALVQGEMLRQFVAMLPGERCSIEANGGKATIRSGGSRVSLVCWTGEGKPYREDVTDGNELRLPGDVLDQALKAVKYARADVQETRDWMRGVQVSAHIVGCVFFTAMDGFRLAMKKIPCAVGANFSATLPADVCDHMMALAAKQRDEEVSLIFSKTGVTYRGKNATLNSGLIAGEWPDVKKLFPGEERKQVACKLPRQDLLKASERANILGAHRGVIVLELRKNGIWVKARGDMGESTEEVGAYVQAPRLQSGDGEAMMRVGLNPKFLRDVLNAMENDEIQMDFSGEISPIVVYPEQGENERHLLLPVRIVAG